MSTERELPGFGIAYYTTSFQSLDVGAAGGSVQEAEVTANELVKLTRQPSHRALIAVLVSFYTFARCARLSKRDTKAGQLAFGRHGLFGQLRCQRIDRRQLDALVEQLSRAAGQPTAAVGTATISANKMVLPMSAL